MGAVNCLLNISRSFGAREIAQEVQCLPHAWPVLLLLLEMFGPRSASPATAQKFVQINLGLFGVFVLFFWLWWESHSAMLSGFFLALLSWITHGGTILDAGNQTQVNYLESMCSSLLYYFCSP